MGDIENTTYGNTLVSMVEFERGDARNTLREKIMIKLGYQFRWKGVGYGKWEPIPIKHPL